MMGKRDKWEEFMAGLPVHTADQVTAADRTATAAVAAVQKSDPTLHEGEVVDADILHEWVSGKFGDAIDKMFLCPHLSVNPNGVGFLTPGLSDVTMCEVCVLMTTARGEAESYLASNDCDVCHEDVTGSIFHSEVLQVVIALQNALTGESAAVSVILSFEACPDCHEEWKELGGWDDDEEEADNE